MYIFLDKYYLLVNNWNQDISDFVSRNWEIDNNTNKQLFL